MGSSGPPSVIHYHEEQTNSRRQATFISKYKIAYMKQR